MAADQRSLRAGWNLQGVLVSKVGKDTPREGVCPNQLGDSGFSSALNVVTSQLLRRQASLHLLGPRKTAGIPVEDPASIGGTFQSFTSAHSLVFASLWRLD